MSYEPSGKLTTDKREIVGSETWDTQTEWTGYQSKDESVTIESGIVRLAEQAFFAITISGTNSPVQEGDILTVSYDADNTGEVSDTQDIRLEIESVQEDVHQDVTLAGGGSRTGTLEWDTSGESAADYTATVLSDDDSDSVTVTVQSPVPDSGDLHARYDATKLSLNDGDAVSTWEDETSNGHDLTAGTAPTYKTGIINGNAVVRFDGMDDILNVSWSQVSQPIHIFMVTIDRGGAQDGAQYQYDGDTLNEMRFSGGPDSQNNEWTIYSGTNAIGSATQDANTHIHTHLYNGSSSVVRMDGVDQTTGDPGGNALNGFTLGGRADGSRFAPIDVGEMLIYPMDKSSVQSDIENYLSDKWGVTL